MSDITITIHGGNNQILPNATEAIQNFYVGEYCGETSLEEGDGRSGLMPETIRFRAYINKEEDLERYLAQIVECRTVTELAQVILVMQENEPKITPRRWSKSVSSASFYPSPPESRRVKASATSVPVSTMRGAVVSDTAQLAVFEKIYSMCPRIYTVLGN